MFICVSIISIPVAATLDKRKLRVALAAAEAQAMSGVDESMAEVGEAEEGPEGPVTSPFDVEVDGSEAGQAADLDGLGNEEMVS